MRLPFGRALRGILVALIVVAGLLGGTLWVLDRYLVSESLPERRPEMRPVPPLEPVTRNSHAIAPIFIEIRAIREVLEAKAPRDATGTQDNPYGDMLGRSQFTWTAVRGPIAMAGSARGLEISSPVGGTAQLSGQATSSRDNIGSRLGALFGREAQDFANRMLEQRAEIRGGVSVSAQPVLLPNWRFDPKMQGQVTLGEMQFAGFRFNAADQIKPHLDKAVNEQMAALSDRLRNDPMLELAVRPEWTRMCRSISLGQTTPGAPPLWLEVRPVRALAAQPRILQDWVVVTVGVQAETRIVPNETKPDCPFPAQLDIQPQLNDGAVSVAVPIDVPMTELNRVLEQELKGKTFTDEAKSLGEITIQSVSVAASGDRLLVSLRVKARETKSWFGLGTEATVHLWGRPTLDASTQIVRLRDVSLDVQTQSASGLIGAAMRAAMPFVRTVLERNAVIDLKPFTANARPSIDTALAGFKQPVEGVEIEAAITDLRLAGIAFDAKTVRVIGEAEGKARVIVRKIPLQ
jgi:hypothetical protein